MIRKAKRSERNLLLIWVLMAALFIVSSCAGTSEGSTTTGSGTEQTLTEDELARFDGLEGRKAYIAVDGVIYDVTDIPQWKDGIHQGRFQAGKDYSQEIRDESPHGLSMLSRATRVGVLAD